MTSTQSTCSRRPRTTYIDLAKHPVFYVGLDLGQVNDYTACAVVEKKVEEQGMPPVYNIRSLFRFPLHTSYPDIVEKVSKALTKEEIQPCLFLVDATGVGVGIADMFRAVGCGFLGITITGGNEVGFGMRTTNVPKRDLVNSLTVLFQTGRLHIAAGIPEAQTLIHELSNFQVEITPSGRDVYHAREGEHDDLVIAVGMATWAGERDMLPRGLRYESKRRSRAIHH